MKASRYFYRILIVALVIFLLPAEYTMGVYTPNYLGWFWLIICLPATLITFIWAGILDIGSKQWKPFIQRVVVFTGSILMAAGYWFYLAYKAGNL